jgi:hypothetical protein
MENEKKNQEQEKTFVVRDKRFSAKEETEPGPKENKIQENFQPEKNQKENESLPEITFTNLLLSVSTSALIQLGEVEDPISRKTSKNLPLAKQTIDLIGMLMQKTKGNLTPEEEKIVESILYDLRLRYVKASD